MIENTDKDGNEPRVADHITGAHLAVLLGVERTDPLSAVVGDDRARILVDWQRDTLYHGRYLLDQNTGRPELDPWVEDVPVVPVDIIAEVLDDHGVDMPTRQEVRTFAETHGGTDPEVELLRARHVTDPDLDAAASPAERRICGVPESIYNGLTEAEQAKVTAGHVIAPPQSPTAVARWLVRHRFSARLLLPVPDGSRRRRKAWMRTLIRIDQTWYHYTRPAGSDGPPRWVARTDPEWMRTQLRGVLGGLWYVKTRRENRQNVYELKWWNPDTQTLKAVEDALADQLAAGTGTHARELPDAYGKFHGVYSDTRATWALCRNGMVDLSTGRLLPGTPLWFSPSMIEADYDQAAHPYADCDWLRMLQTQWLDDPGAVTCLQQWFGYVISGRTDLQKWMLICGPSGSGKSIIADVLGSLMGVVSATKLDTLNSQFGLQAIYETGAQLAVMSDIRFGARDSSTAVGNLLGVTGEDEVTVERKYKTAVTAKLGVRFHGSANEMPRWSDNSNALARRALLLETRRGFRGTADEDPGLKKRIIANELGQVLRWAIEGLALLDAADGAFTRSARAAELDDELAELSSAVRTFVGECCELGSAVDYVEMRLLYDVWRKWAAENNTGQGMSQNKFRAALKALYLDPVRPGQKQMPDGKTGKWLVVWGVKYAETGYTERGPHGIEIRRTISTDPAEPAGDPTCGRRNLN